MVAPLAGVKVVEVTSWMAAPSAAAVLADMGADVVKVEPPRGDAVRGLMRPPKSPPGLPSIDYSFTADNRGKRSAAIAVDSPEGAQLVHKLVAGADVFICNLLHRRQHRYGLDATTLLGVNPRLVHASLTGFGPTGPDAERAGYDVTVFFGRGAIVDTMTEPGGLAPHPRPAQGDHAAGMALVAAVLAALRLAEQTGEGQVVDVNLLAMAAWTMATDLSSVLVDGRQPSKRDRRHVMTPLAGRFRCSDDRFIVLNMPEARWWAPFCAALERPEWVADPRFDTLRSRYQNMPELMDMIDEIFASKPMHEWSRVLDDAGLISGPAATLAELAADPQASAAAMFPEIEHPAGGFRTIGVPFTIHGADIAPRGPAPDVGQHSVEVLGSVGLSPDDVSALAAAGIVGPASLAGEQGGATEPSVT